VRQGAKWTVDLATATVTPNTLSLRVAATPRQAPLLRAHLRLWLTEQGASEDEIHDILLAANEAFGNAITHARQTRPIAVHVDASINDRVVEVVVRDHGRWQESPHTGGVGLGLALMHALADTVEVHAAQEGTTVRLRRALGSESRSQGIAAAPARDRVELLRRSPIFAPLPQATLERLAEQLIPFSASAHETLIREGDQGDLFYLVGQGQLDVSIEGSHVATLGNADSVGEIALLRDGRRTATIVTKEPVQLYALTREDFLAAVTSDNASAHAAESLIATRLIELRDILARTA
jgi:anti-sigma regulatory factor (Ser/Thr protein kinase)